MRHLWRVGRWSSSSTERGSLLFGGVRQSRAQGRSGEGNRADYLKTCYLT